MVTRFADGIVDAITDSIVPEVSSKITSPEETLEEMRAVQRVSASNRRRVGAELRNRRAHSITRDQLDIAVRRAIREVSTK